MFTPGISQISEDLDTTEASVVGATTGFVVALGIGPLVFAPLSKFFLPTVSRHGDLRLTFWGIPE